MTFSFRPSDSLIFVSSLLLSVSIGATAAVTSINNEKPAIDWRDKPVSDYSEKEHAQRFEELRRRNRLFRDIK